MRAGTGRFLAQPPIHRKLRIGNPILQIRPAEMPDFAQLPRLDHLFGEGNSRHTPIIEYDHVAHMGFANGCQHFLGVSDIEGERLFAQDVLAGACGSQRNFGVRNIRGANVDHFDQRRFHYFAPVSGGVLPAQLAAGRLDAAAVPSADRVHLDFSLQGEKVRDLPPGIRVGFPHESVSDESDSQCLGHIQSWG